MWKGTQFMTEKAGGSDIGRIETVARNEGGTWRLYGEKWFCSHTDADVALILARPEGAPAGTKGLALFALPRRLEDGTRNSYRIVRLKDKLGTRSMASGEIRLEGAVAYPVGRLDQGLKQMMDQVNLSRLSHGVRAAAMMRRCVNEALTVARHRVAFGKPVIEHPLVRRQLMKLIVPTEQALSMAMAAAAVMGEADAGSAEAADALRILTPLVKFRACRDNVAVATGAMEMRGGNGYIEEWVNPRLVRDAQIGLLWEGTSNINALDVIGRAVGKSRAHKALEALLRGRLKAIVGLPAAFTGRLETALGAGDGIRRAGGAGAGLRAASAARGLGALSRGKRRAAGLGGHAARRRRPPRAHLALRAGASPVAEGPAGARRRAWEEQAIALLLDDGAGAADACRGAAGIGLLEMLDHLRPADRHVQVLHQAVGEGIDPAVHRTASGRAPRHPARTRRRRHSVTWRMTLSSQRRLRRACVIGDRFQLARCSW